MKKYIRNIIFMGALVAPVTSKPVAQKIDYSEWAIPVFLTVGTAYCIWSSWDSSRPLFRYPTQNNFSKPSRVVNPHEEKIDVSRRGLHMLEAERGIDVSRRSLRMLQTDRIAEVNEVTLRQLPVSQQGHNNDGGASCGYHALKNAIGVLSYELGYLTNIQIITDRFSLTPGSWRAKVQAQLRDFGVDALQADWLSVDAFEGLIEEFLPTKNYSIIDVDGKSCKGFDNAWNVDELDRVAQTIDRYAGQEYKYVFFINTARIAELRGDRFAHWYVLVMDKQADGSTTYTVMDSLGNERHNDETVLKIIRRIHQ